MSAAMDMFLATDSLPFPDVLDIDIKQETGDLFHGHNDFSCFDLGTLEPIEFERTHDIKWFSSNSNHSIFDLSGEDGPAMVNPSAVMPINGFGRSPSPVVKEKSHFSFSPAAIKVSASKNNVVAVKKDLIHRLEGMDKIVVKKPVPPPTIVKTVKVPILAKPASIKPITIRTTTHPPAIVIKNTIRQVTAPVITSIRSVPTVLSQHIQRKAINLPKTDDDFRPYPKPAYSYSCLIAMALKNSRNGSLPVSEIYNFMCKHFPYFKTAPSGWKNSVRHNLSLNKCFEKIEKPALNGAQRKGCLWAMNPDKINKMDEEVLKWSRKDPNAIKKAMVNPENLESLERGELKFSCAYDEEEGEQYGDSCGSVESGEGSESEGEMQEEMETEDTEVDIQYIQVKAADIAEFEEVHEAYDEYEEEKLLRSEMALAQRELEYERNINNKRRKIFVI